MPIVAALTNGDAENVFVGRNGLFYDRKGDAWDATVTKIVSNPISIREAFWSPYKKVIKVVEDAVAKSAAKADEEANTKLADGAKSTAAEVGEAAETGEEAAPPPPPPPAAPPAAAKKFDLSTVALIGVALGGIGTLFGTLFGALFGLGVWMPVGVVALLLMISGPSMLLAWLKLRRRNLGPLLDANGWAINSRAKIDVPFGATMTGLPALPKGAERSGTDPYAERTRPWKTYFLIALVLAFGVAWYFGKLDRWVPMRAKSTTVLGESAPRWPEKAAADKEAADKAAADKAAADKAAADKAAADKAAAAAKAPPPPAPRRPPPAVARRAARRRRLPRRRRRSSRDSRRAKREHRDLGRGSLSRSMRDARKPDPRRHVQLSCPRRPGTSRGENSGRPSS